jgi:chromosome segregation ATPase
VTANETTGHGELRGLETMCAALHAATETDPLVKDVAWRTFALIRAHREQATEMDRYARSVEALRVNRDQLKDKLAAADGVIADLKAELAEMESAAADWAARLVGHQARDDQAESRIAEALDLASRLDPTSGHGRVRAFISDLRNVLTGGGR